MTRIAVFILLAGLLAAPIGAAAAALDSPAPAAMARPDGPVVTDPGYRIAPDDVLQLTVWGEPAMNGIYITVTPEGNIVAPVVGSVPAAGRTVDEVRDEIARRFVANDYLRDPTVQLTLYQVHKMRVRVLGQVNRPGLQLMRDGDTVDQAVAEAGSFIPDMADLKGATITRLGEGQPMPVDLDAFYFDGDISQNVKLKDGDTVYIPEDTENKFYVMGMVQRPTQYPLKKTTTVTQAISMAGGPTERGALGRTVVIRKRADGGSDTINIDVAKLLETGDTSKDFKLQPGDVVMVRETTKPNLNVIGQVLSGIYQVVVIKRWGL